MAGETLVEKCREIDQTNATEEKVNPTDEQISQYRLVLEEWQKRNVIVKDVFEGKTRFETEVKESSKDEYDENRQKMFFQCIPNLKELHNKTKTSEYIGFGAGGLLIAPVVLSVACSRRDFLTGLLICGGAAVGGAVVGGITYGCARAILVPNSLDCY
ncbi:MAG: twin-arginine translocation signal domain-containing protein, partial [Nanoarchaeota archaeon]|nr:twin-arginine translocation signal domain-containing protein [Nanoarchaeota archaeon]